jgi:hypothetical protein
MDGAERVIAAVAGHDVWFESSDAELRASPEAFASAFLIPALHRGASLESTVALDSAWLENTRELLPIYRQWWGYSDRHPVRSRESRPVESAEPRARSRAAFFTGGVDSFHTLLRSNEEIDCLVYVHGYDIPLADRERMDAYEQSFREVAGHYGVRAILVRTNLREHPLFAEPTWHYSHGGGLAAAAHVLAPSVESALVSSSYRYEREIPWGTSWRTDPCWSSSMTTLKHGDATLGHHQKLIEIAREPWVQNHLRVCFKNLSPTGNCSRCEKCVRTMVTLQAAGTLEHFSVFDTSVALAERIRSFGRLPRRMLPIWAEVADRSLPADTRRAIRQIVRRTKLRRFRKVVRSRFRRVRSRFLWGPRQFGVR